MRLDRLPEYLLSLIVTLAGLIFALYAGSQLGSGNTRNLMMIAGGFAYLAIGLIFKDRIWVLPFIFLPATGRLLGTPLSLSDATILLAFSWFLILKAFKLVKAKPSFELVDLFVGLNVLYVATMFIRNPVGGLAVDSDMIGGRPYLTLVFAIMAYWVFCRSEVSAKLVQRLPFFSVLAIVPGFLVSTISFIVPGATMGLAKIYAGIEVISDNFDISSESGGSRIPLLGPPGMFIGKLLVALYRPITLINPLNFWRMLFMAVAVGAILLAGFRSQFIFFVLIAAGCAYYRGKLTDLVRIGVLFVPVFGLFIALQGSVIELPFPIQRTLSFLPGKWNERAIGQAEDSTNWRIQMWTWMWNEEKYLKNWWLGDGYGYSQKVMLDNLAAAARGDMAAAHEGFLITGQLHSGPFSALRFAGYIGLTLYVLLLVVFIRHSSRLMRKAMGTPFFVPSLFFVTPMAVYLPFFLLVFGAYEADVPKTIAAVGVLKLLERGLDRYLAEQKQEAEVAKEPEALGNALDQRPALLTR